MKRFFLILPGKNYLLHKNIVQFFFSQICFPEGTKLTPNQVEKLRKFEGEVVVGGGGGMTSTPWNWGATAKVPSMEGMDIFWNYTRWFTLAFTAFFYKVVISSFFPPPLY